MCEVKEIPEKHSYILAEGFFSIINTIPSALAMQSVRMKEKNNVAVVPWVFPQTPGSIYYKYYNNTVCTHRS